MKVLINQNETKSFIKNIEDEDWNFMYFLATCIFGSTTYSGSESVASSKLQSYCIIVFINILFTYTATLERHYILTIARQNTKQITNITVCVSCNAHRRPAEQQTSIKTGQ